MDSSIPSLSEDLGGVEVENSQKDVLGGASISKIEDALKQKTFTRSEFDKLTELLRSRTVDLSSGNENDEAAPNRSSQPKDQLDKMTNASPLVHDNERGESKLIESSLKHGTVLNVPEMEIASPAELAKAYMNSRLPRPLSSRLKSSPLREIASFPGSSQKLADGSVASRSVIRFSKLLENGHAAREFQGRPSLPKLSQSPTRGHSSVKKQESDQSIITNPGPLRFQMVSPNNDLSASNMNLKRRSSVLDIDTGSIRRTKQKSSIVTPSKEVKFSPFKKPLYTASPRHLQDSVDCITKPCLLDSAKYKNTMIEEAKDRDEKAFCTSFASVPQQSSAMARKILQQLDHLVPSPKERHLEQKFGGRDGLTTKSSRDGLATKSSFTTYLNGMAVGSKDSELSKIFDVVDKPPSTPMVPLQDGVETSGPISRCVSGTVMTSPPKASNGCSSSTMEAKPGGLSVRAIPSSVAATPQNKLFTVKRVPESPLEMDAETHDSKSQSSMLIGKENNGLSTGEHSSVYSEAEPQKTMYLFNSTNNNDKKVMEGNTSLSAVPIPHSSDTPAVLSSFRQPDPTEEDFTIPVFSFGLKKVHSLVFPSTVRSGDSSGLKCPMKPEPNFQISMSISQVAKGDENVSEEPPVFTFGSRSATTDLSNGVPKPNRVALSFATQVSSNPASNLSDLDNSSVFGTSSSLVGLSASNSSSNSCITPLFNKPFSSPVPSNLKDLSAKSVGISGSTSSFGFPAQTGSIFGFGMPSSAIGFDTSTPASMPTSVVVGPSSSLLSNFVLPPLQSGSKDSDRKPFEVSSSAPLASFSAQASGVFGLTSAPSSTSLGFTASHLLGSQASCLALEPSSSAPGCMNCFSHAASTPVFSSSSTFAPFSSTSSSSAVASASATMTSMIEVPQITADCPGGDRPKVGDKATHDSIPSVAPLVPSPVGQFGSKPSPALFQSHTILQPFNSDSPADGRFSIGSTGDDKSARRIIRVKRERIRR